MKKHIAVMLLGVLFTFSSTMPVRAQSDELQQLLLNIEKLSQLKSILNNMYKGYQAISQGYSTIKNLAEGNFSIHKLFMDGLMAVSPAVRNYYKVGQIVSKQKDILKEYRASFQAFQQMDVFDHDYLSYISSVYDRLFDRSLKDLDDLLMVVTANQLRMDDAERLAAIDRIHHSVSDKLAFLRHFNTGITAIANDHMKSRKDLDDLRQLNGTPQNP